MDSRDLRWLLKHALRFSPPLTRKRGLREDAAALFGSLDPGARQRLQTLQQRYRLSDWPRLCVAMEYRENLTLLDLLDRYLPVPPAGARGLDVGCRNFSYLPALSAFSDGRWDGSELDAHARYWNGLTRRAYGEWMARQRSGCRYLPGSVLHWRDRYDLIVWLLPFVVEEPLQWWGLPQRFFQPLALLQHVYGLLQPGGTLFIVNQGEAEAEVQAALCRAAGLQAVALGELQSPFSPFRHRRFGWLLRAGIAAAPLPP
ncbi:MAG: hypothetical protein ACO280_11410 [Pseudohongiellaceae bacterium]|jgi:hypothetical protein